MFVCMFIISFNYNNWMLKSTQMLINRKIDKFWYIHNVKYQPTIRNNRDKCQRKEWCRKETKYQKRHTHCRTALICIYRVVRGNHGWLGGLSVCFWWLIAMEVCIWETSVMTEMFCALIRTPQKWLNERLIKHFTLCKWHLNFKMHQNLFRNLY
jgi:hypothetical protein